MGSSYVGGAGVIASVLVVLVLGGISYVLVAWDRPVARFGARFLRVKLHDDYVLPSASTSEPVTSGR